MCVVRVFNAWTKWRNKQPTEEGALGRYVHDLHGMNNREINYWLARFVHEVRRQDGKPYPPSTCNHVAGLQRSVRASIILLLDA